jgi:hypothetical protein
VQPYLFEIAAKVVVRSDSDPEELPADVYARITEFIGSEEDLLALEIEMFPLPDANSGSSDRWDDADSEEGGEEAMA